MTTKFGWIVTGLLVTLSPGTVLAQNNTCATSALMASNDLKRFTLQEATADSERWYAFNAVFGRSYCVEVVGDGTENNSWNSVLALGNDCATIIATNDDANDEPLLASGSRLCFVAAATANVFARVTPFAGSAPTAKTFNIRTIETTQFSPFWQVVSSAGYDAAPQIRNNTSNLIHVSFTTYDAAGVATGCVGLPIIQVPGNGMATFGISSQCAMSTGFGSAQIAHDGPPGAITANITTFSSPAGLSFDADFEPRQDYRH